MDGMVMSSANWLARLIASAFDTDIEKVTKYEHAAEFDMTFNYEKFIITVRQRRSGMNNYPPLMNAKELKAEAERLKTANAKLIKGNDRYEKLRRMNPKDFSALWLESLEGDKTFDGLVDALPVTAYKEGVTE
jgi:hypothetical protein